MEFLGRTQLHPFAFRLISRAIVTKWNLVGAHDVVLRFNIFGHEFGKARFSRGDFSVKFLPCHFPPR